MNSVLIMFLRSLGKELSDRADGWARDAGSAASPDLKDRFSITAAVLRELGAAIGAAAKATVLA